MHGLRYMWLIGNGNSSAHLSMSINIPYHHGVQKFQSLNHTVKCYRGVLEKLAKGNSIFKGKMVLRSINLPKA